MIRLVDKHMDAPYHIARFVPRKMREICGGRTSETV